jgi:hypothetical protein
MVAFRIASLPQPNPHRFYAGIQRLPSGSPPTVNSPLLSGAPPRRIRRDMRRHPAFPARPLGEKRWPRTPKGPKNAAKMRSETKLPPNDNFLVGADLGVRLELRAHPQVRPYNSAVFHCNSVLEDIRGCGPETGGPGRARAGKCGSGPRRRWPGAALGRWVGRR